jgi:hypothetical protein
MAPIIARPSVKTMPPMNESPLHAGHLWAGPGFSVVDGDSVLVDGGKVVVLAVVGVIGVVVGGVVEVVGATVVVVLGAGGSVVVGSVEV